MFVALDTNILIYAEGVNGKPMQARALAILDRLSPESTLVPLQVMGELFNVLTKTGRSRAKARETVLRWGDTYPLIETSSTAQLLAMDLAVDHQFGIWDALVLAAAADASCRLLLSEDLQDGFTWSGVTITNPFSAKPHPALATLLAEP